MGHKTKMEIVEDKFYINGKLTYSEIADCPYQGLLMNARFIQGIYDDKNGLERYQRFGRTFEPESNTDQMIASLQEWYNTGLRAFTVGLQGGGPCFSLPLDSIDNNPYGKDGKKVDPAYLKRLAKVIDAADEIGMVVIVSLFYGVQSRYLEDDDAVESATHMICRWLGKRGDQNVIIEIANEHNTGAYECHNVLHQENGILKLMEIAKQESGGMPVSCSGTGGYFSERIAQASDVILIHGNEVTRNQFYNIIRKAKEIKPARPIVTNEDSQALSQMGVTFKTGVSWGYYNNMTKQEPPVDWGITKGEDRFFALRLKEYLTGKKTELPLEEQFYLQGLEKDMIYENKRWIRLASLYPEKIDYVEFFRDGELYQMAFDDPFCVNFVFNWAQYPVEGIKANEHWKAVVHLTDETVVEKEVVVE